MYFRNETPICQMKVLLFSLYVYSQSVPSGINSTTIEKNATPENQKLAASVLSQLQSNESSTSATTNTTKPATPTPKSSSSNTIAFSVVGILSFLSL